MNSDISFREYLLAKKIDAHSFRQSEELLFEEMKDYFMNVHPESFTAQKLFLINAIRRKYLLKETEIENAKPKTPLKPKHKKP